VLAEQSDQLGGSKVSVCGRRKYAGTSVRLGSSGMQWGGWIGERVWWGFARVSCGVTREVRIKLNIPIGTVSRNGFAGWCLR